jgi:formylglycine-generating enzyme required for sulfatase activity
VKTLEKLSRDQPRPLQHDEAALPMTSSERKRTKVFVSYSHEDAPWLNRLKVHIQPLIRDGLVDFWDDTKIQPGMDLTSSISEAINSASVAILLISADFMASDFIASNELPPLLEAAEKDGALIRSIILSPSLFTITPSLSRFQSVNPPDRPLIGMTKVEQEEVFVKATDAIREAEEKRLRAEEEQRRTIAEEEARRKAGEEEKRKAEAEARRRAEEDERRRAEEEEQRRVEEKARRKAKEEERKGAKEFTNSLGMKFVLIPAGTFMMGSPPDEINRRDDENLHNVTISNPFYMKTTQVTQGQWRKVMRNNPSGFETRGDNCPVESVSWDDAQEFIRKLNQMERTDKYRLPAKAEWEYACRAGSTTRYYFGDDEAELGKYAWYSNNSDGTHPVGQKKPNAWGLYDMHGNVWEWCQDWYGEYTRSVTDPKGPKSGEGRVLRGGSWFNNARGLRSAYRHRLGPGYRDDSIGFRLARDT